jgi:hypothetical protein
MFLGVVRIQLACLAIALVASYWIAFDLHYFGGGKSGITQNEYGISAEGGRVDIYIEKFRRPYSGSGMAITQPTNTNAWVVQRGGSFSIYTEPERGLHVGASHARHNSFIWFSTRGFVWNGAEVGDCGFTFGYPGLDERDTLDVHLWLVATLLSALCYPVIRRSIRPRAAGVGGSPCIKCGYDLRASKDRCPECGTPIPLDKTRDRPPGKDLKPPQPDPPPEPLPPA